MTTKPKFLKSVGKMGTAEKIELLVELQEMARWLSDAPSEKDAAAAASLEKRLWHTAVQFRANSGLKPWNTPGRSYSIHSVEKTDETSRLCCLNLAVHGLEGDIRHDGQVNSYYDDTHDATGCVGFVIANSASDARASVCVTTGFDQVARLLRIR